MNQIIESIQSTESALPQTQDERLLTPEELLEDDARKLFGIFVKVEFIQKIVSPRDGHQAPNEYTYVGSPLVWLNIEDGLAPHMEIDDSPLGEAPTQIMRTHDSLGAFGHNAVSGAVEVVIIDSSRVVKADLAAHAKRLAKAI